MDTVGLVKRMCGQATELPETSRTLLVTNTAFLRLKDVLDHLP